MIQIFTAFSRLHSLTMTLTAFAILSLVSSSFAGTRDTAGGNAGSSSLEAVIDELRIAQAQGLEFLMILEATGFPRYSSALNEDLKPALTKMFGRSLKKENWPVYKVLKNLGDFKIQSQGCVGPDGHADASTEFHLGATICFSTDRLMRTPELSLNKEIKSLLFHELSHQFGFDEKTAVLVQGFVRDRETGTWDSFMNQLSCQTNSSWAACLLVGASLADQQLARVTTRLGSCVSSQKGEEARKALNVEEAAFLAYKNSILGEYSIDNGPHAAQANHADVLQVILQRTEMLKEKLRYCESTKH